MGSFFSSYSVHQAQVGELRQVVVRWLGAKGFVLMDGPQRFALDPTHERGVAIIRGADWSTVLYSDLCEEERLLFELAKLGRPVLHLWLHDSDVWGYELHQDRQVVATFNSNPRSFGMLARSGDAADGIEPLCRLSADPQVEARLRRLHRQRATFMDEVCEAFCMLFGIEGAASSFAYVAAGECPVEDRDALEILWFRHHEFDPMAGFHLHRVEARCSETVGGLSPVLARHYQRMVQLLGEDAARRAWKRAMESVESGQGQDDNAWAADGPLQWNEGEDGIDPDTLRQLQLEMEELRRRARRQLQERRWSLGCTLAVLRPLTWLAGLLAGALVRRRMMTAESTLPQQCGAAPASASAMRESDGWLSNELHGCRVRLARGVTVPPSGASVFLNEPVLAFRIGGLDAWCTAQRPEAVRRLLTSWPPGSVIDETNDTVRERPLKTLVVRGIRDTRRFAQLAAMIQCEEGVYVFQTAEVEEVAAEQLESFRSTVLSFELDA